MLKYGQYLKRGAFVLDHRALRGWKMYDWANSAFATTMMAAVLPVYYSDVAGVHLAGNRAETYWGYTQSIAMLLVAVLSPILGAIADYTGSKLRFLSVFMLLGVLSCVFMAFAGEGDWLLASSLMVLGSIGFSGGNTFYDAMLADGVPQESRDRVSSQGYAYGYAGGGLLLLINVIMIQGWEKLGFPSKTFATQMVFITVGIWWLLFSVPILRWVKETRRPTDHLGKGEIIRAGFVRIGKTFSVIKRYPELLKYMASFWFFNDGINTVIVMATIYGAGIGIETSDLIIALLITQFVGWPCTILFGRLAGRFGSKRMLYYSLMIYVLIVCLGFFMTSAIHFYALAIMVGLVQGGSQAVARSIYANLVPPSRTGEFFGFLALSSKFSSFAGPFVFSVVGTITGSSRVAILSLIAFFIIGIVLLWKVNLEKGAREAAEEEMA
ncbi:MFS transporter [Paenibacillus glycanilyticus]|uniref:MFS transporter n=1 Tax=Paenibacillus glycanilyticus TaxID=126569 RepID=UPI000FDB85BA